MSLVRVVVGVCCVLLLPRFVLAQDAGTPAPTAPAPTAPAPDAGVQPPAAVEVDAGVAPPPPDAAVVTAADAGAEFDPFAELQQAPPAPAPTPTEEVAPEQDLFKVDAVDVVGSLEKDAKKAPGAVYVLDEKQLAVFGNDDATQVVRQVPGVYVRQEDGYGLRPNIGIRGADSDRSKKITLLEDGVLFGPAPYSAPAAYYFPLMMRMVGIEAFKGASAIRQGPQTIGGGLDFHTREVPERGGLAAVDGSFGNTYYTKLHAYGGYGTERMGFLAEGASMSSQGFKKLDGGGDTGFNKQEFMLKGRINTDPDAKVYQRLEGKVGYSREDSNETYTGLTDADFRDKPLRRYRGTQLDEMNWWRTQGELFHTLGVGEHFELKTVAYRHDYSRLWNRVDGFTHLMTPNPLTEGDAPIDPASGMFDVLSSPGGFEQQYRTLSAQDTSANTQYGILQAGNHRRFVSQGIQSVGHGTFETGQFAHDIEVGVRVHNDSIARNHTANGYLMEHGSDPNDLPHLVSDGIARGKLAFNTVSTLAVALHAAYGITYRRLTLTPGVRTEIIRASYHEKLTLPPGVKHTKDSDTQTVLFALGALYEVTDQVSVLAGVQQGMSPVAPTLTDAQSPERAINYEFGGRYTDVHGKASAVGFVSDYDKIVVPCDGEGCGSSATNTNYASKRALIGGIELNADYGVVLPRSFVIPVRVAYTYTHAQFKQGFNTNYAIYGGPDSKVDAGDYIPYIPPHQGSFGSGLSYREWVGFDVQLTYVDRMREIAGQGALEKGFYTDRYAMLDASAYYQVIKKLRLYLKGDNLTNNQPIVSRRPFGARPNKPLLVQIGFKWEM